MFVANQNRQGQGVVPASIEIGKTLAYKPDRLGLPGGGCSGAVFRLRASSARAIDAQGLTFFEGIRRPRQYEQMDARYRESNYYGQWRPTPITHDVKINEGAFAWYSALKCSNLSDDWKAEMRRQMLVSGSYYAASRNGHILVSPKDKTVSYFYAD